MWDTRVDVTVAKKACGVRGRYSMVANLEIPRPRQALDETASRREDRPPLTTYSASPTPDKLLYSALQGCLPHPRFELPFP